MAPLGVAIATAFLNACAVCVTKYYMDRQVKEGLDISTWSGRKRKALDLAARPFTIICFFEAANLLKSYQESVSWKGCIPYAVSLFLMTITKPGYTMVLVPLMGVLFLFDLVKSRGRSVWSNYSKNIPLSIVMRMALVLVLRNTIEWRKSWKVIFLPAEWAVFLFHLVCGINFLWYALRGKDLAGF